MLIGLMVIDRWNLQLLLPCDALVRPAHHIGLFQDASKWNTT